MDEKTYYLVYEERYKLVYEAGVERWGHGEDDVGLRASLTEWVDRCNLRGKRVVEFACGEGASGVILSQLGCLYHGVDVAPSAVAKARAALAGYPGAKVTVLDMAHEPVEGQYDAALDVMGFHMLVVDADRAAYLQNVHSCLKNGAPFFLFRESYREHADDSPVDSFERWLKLTGDDYRTPQTRCAGPADAQVEVQIPMVPARAKTEAGYRKELLEAGFVVDCFQPMMTDMQIVSSAAIYAHRP
ncbi:class I SAM-dependent methyltransferase [Paenibacillus mesotrionivorans]|uniref:Class I SAM-dependent methyltransferase n=1 Tax=Paenibacillus mesotrionivorans TaxID=3160968 RepID=A0ACC7P3L4_9BACL